ncbi:MAG: Ger(x)C family spore germination protein [Eubacteriales bacterium]|nr:Ger(x)C family spore germination protein [Eubacteriales bacterium]MDD4769700.1 Ger(x)C family spore germination protein [Eubacteriales bacterium]
MKKRIDILISILIVALLISGCWSRREMESLAYILVLGIDQGENGNFKIYAQVGKPNQTTDGGGEQPVFQTLTSEGRDMSEAVADLFLKSTKIPDLSHLQLLIFSNKLAANGIQQVLDFLRRDFSIRENIRVAVAAVNIEDLLKIEEKLGNQPAMAIINQFLINTQRSTVVQAEFKDLVSQMLEPDLQAVLPMIGASEDRFTLGKSAVFDGYKMAATLDMPETLGLQLWRDRVKTGYVTIPQSVPGKVISFKIINSKTKVRANLKDNKLFVQANIDITLDIQEMFEVDSEELKMRTKHYFVNRMRDTLQVAKDEGIEFLGISALLRREDPQKWEEVKNSWKEVLQQAEYDLRCNVHIRGQGPVR